MTNKRHAQTPLSSEPPQHLAGMTLRNRALGQSDITMGRGRGRGIVDPGFELASESGFGRGRGRGRGSGGGRTEDIREVFEPDPSEQVNNEQIQRQENNSTINDQVGDLNLEGNESFTVDQMINLSHQKIFPLKCVYFGAHKKKYTPVLHFFDHECEFDEFSEKAKIKFICKQEKCVKHESFGALSNLNKHLLLHEKSKQWYQNYVKSKKKTKSGMVLSDAKLNLIKFFITSNLALKQLENVYLRKCLKDEIKLPCVKTFRTTFINEIIGLLHDKIQIKCQEASFITLIPDQWSDTANTHFLGTENMLL